MVTLHFLHGFLGLAEDWNIVLSDFPHFSCIAHALEDYMPTCHPEILTRNEHVSLTLHKTISPFKSWAQKFNDHVFSRQNQTNQKNILIGYSLGGRLALHSLQETSNWDAAILVSVNPGLTNDSLKIQRFQQDEIWAQRFANEAWDSVLDAWNHQSVFTNQKNTLKRCEDSYNRNLLSTMMRCFSLGLQNDLRDVIKKIQIPILWLVGEHDEKFVKIAQEMSNLSYHVKHAIVPQSGHRIPWESQDYFAKICNDFLKDLYILQE